MSLEDETTKSVDFYFDLLSKYRKSLSKNRNIIGIKMRYPKSSWITTQRGVLHEGGYEELETWREFVEEYVLGMYVLHGAHVNLMISNPNLLSDVEQYYTLLLGQLMVQLCNDFKWNKDIKVYRGLNLQKSNTRVLNKFVEDVKSKEWFVENKFNSTSIDRSTAIQFIRSSPCCLLDITIKKGTNFIPLRTSSYRKEFELLLPPFVEMKASREKKNYKEQVNEISIECRGSDYQFELIQNEFEDTLYRYYAFMEQISRVTGGVNAGVYMSITLPPKDFIDVDFDQIIEKPELYKKVFTASQISDMKRYVRDFIGLFSPSD